MAVFVVDQKRFQAAGNAQENAEKHRRSVSNQVVANVRPPQPDNGDFAQADKRGSFSKGLKHDPITGLVDPAAFTTFANALSSDRLAVFAAIEAISDAHRGFGVNTRKWVNPVAGRAFAVVGGDPQQFDMPAAPAFGSDELTFEIAENYWMAALRDVPFCDYDSSPLAQVAALELTGLRNAAVVERAAAGKPAEELAPIAAGAITPQLLFRGLTPGDRVGPYLSQFLIHPVPFGVQGFHQRNKTLRAGQDFMTAWNEWLAVQNGAKRDFVPSHFDDELHYVRNGRDLSQWVHIDVLFQGYFNACLMLLHGSGAASSIGGGIGANASQVNPYALAGLKQEGFGTFGGPGHIGMMCEVAALALKAVWFQKWYVHLRLRPEVYAGRIDLERRVPGTFNLPANLMNSTAVQGNLLRYGSALLPMAFPEGSPMHPAYGAGHATVAGACVTILKALFDVSGQFPNPIDMSVDQTGRETLMAYTCGPLTIEGELNKLASNIALGRNIAGVHWRSDGTYSLQLGEQVAIKLLEAYARSYAELAPGTLVFRFNKFDGGQQDIVA
ncbi:MAG: vanadium-dependent haloperoxidase [Nitrospira sp.]|nr:vanadium-dependent haloperoxidase [Nitrospira sp.]MDH4343124.1 vanadium-dependent haloperoxidase [Nitrospira sp.]MDH5336121.1 vanadium-dependent haloperoxidase [Nitrospira sp.]